MLWEYILNININIWNLIRFALEQQSYGVSKKAK